MKTRQRIFDYICQATAEWNRIFSIPLLFIISSKLVTVSCSLFGFIQGLIILNNNYMSMMRWLMLSTSLLDAVILAIIFTAADMPVNEVETYLTYCSIHNILIILIGSSYKQVTLSICDIGNKT